MEKKYIAKSDAWFDMGSEAILIEQINNVGDEMLGNFEGIYTVGETAYNNFWLKKGHKIGDKVVMREVCSYNEFKISNRLPDAVVINKLIFDFMSKVFESQPKDFIDSDTIEQIKNAWILGFKAGFKYLDDELEKK